MIIKNTDKKDSDKVLKEIPYLSEKAFLKLWAYLKWLKLNVIKMNEWLWQRQRQNKIKTRPGVQQCQAQGLVFCPWLGLI